jgi:hypothetical protein
MRVSRKARRALHPFFGYVFKAISKHSFFVPSEDKSLKASHNTARVRYHIPFFVKQKKENGYLSRPFFPLTFQSISLFFISGLPFSIIGKKLLNRDTKKTLTV